MNKNVKLIAAIVGALIILVLVIATIFRTSSEQVSNNPGHLNVGGTISLTGQVLDIDQSALALDGPTLLLIETTDGYRHTIAVPSMGIQLCEAYPSISNVGNIAIGDEVQVLGLVEEEEHIVPCSDTRHYLKVSSTFRDDSYGYEFSYPKGPHGYLVLGDGGSTDISFKTGLILFSEDEYADYASATGATEGPAAMHVRIYENTELLHAAVWAQRHPLESNIELAFDEPEEAVVGGANAIHYTTDGLYPLSTYVVAHGGYIYVLMGAYPSTDAPIYQDFAALVSSFTFVPIQEMTVAGKIDPVVACQNALSYRSFTDSTAADAFVADCVAGKHPEVIEQYLNSLGHDSASI